MKPAPLQLTDYFITKLHLKANPDYDRENDTTANLDTIEVTHNAMQLKIEENKATKWRVTMTIKQNVPKGRNIPYKFELEIQGEVYVFPVFESKRLETVVKANGPAMLFGVAREIIRAATGRGPFPAVVIPSTNFIEAPKKKVTKRVTAKKAAKKVARKIATKKSAAKKKSAGKKS